MSASPAALAAADGVSEQAQPSPQGVMPCPFKFAIEIQVIDSDGGAALAVPVELRQGPNEAIRSKTDSRGVARFEGLLAQAYEFSLYTLYPEAWTVTGSEKLETPNSTHGPAKWQGIAKPKTKDTQYEVKEGECSSKIGARFGVPAQTIWDSNAALHATRPDMNLLVPGDKLTIPGFQPRYEQAAGGSRYIVKLGAPASRLRVRFLDADGNPRSDLDYLVEFTCDPPVESAEGALDGGGWLVEPVPPQAVEAKITLAGVDGPEEFQMRISRLEPVSTTRGLQARLYNLGYGSGGEDGEIGPPTKAALRLFQLDHGLKPTGEADDNTRKKLAEMHQS